MYRNPLFYLAAAVLTAVAIFFGALAYEIVHIGYELRHDVDSVTAHTVQQVDGLDVKTLSNKFSTTLDAVNSTAKKEQDSLDADNILISATLAGVDELVAHLDIDQDKLTTATTATLGAAKGTLDASTDTIKAAQPLLASATKTTDDVGKFINAPALTETIGNVQVITKNVGDITVTANKVTTKAAAPYLKPPSKNPIKRELSTIGPAIVPVLKIVAAFL